MALIKMFKAQKDTKRFRANQKVWVSHDCGNHAYIRFKWRGRGRYVNGVIAKWSEANSVTWNPTIGDVGFHEIEVDDAFAERILK